TTAPGAACPHPVGARSRRARSPRVLRAARDASERTRVNLARAVRTLHHRQWVPHPIEAVFDFFEHPENLALITPPWLGLRLRTPGPLTMRAGLVIDYHVRALGWT